MFPQNTFISIAFESLEIARIHRLFREARATNATGDDKSLIVHIIYDI